MDVNFVCAMGPPGGGRNPTTARLLRHFNFVAFTEMEDDSLQNIFSVILKSWISKGFSDFSKKNTLLSYCAMLPIIIFVILCKKIKIGHNNLQEELFNSVGFGVIKSHVL